MKATEAEAVLAALQTLALSASVGERRMFHVERMWIDQSGDAAAVCMVFRQGQQFVRLGCRQSDLVSIITGDRVVDPDEMALDLYSLVLREPHDPEPLTPDAEGVRWFAEE